MPQRKILLPVSGPAPAMRRLVSPYPVVLVTCVNKEGKPNIITVSIVCKLWGQPMSTSDIPIYMIAIHHARYSHKLIEETGEFVINVPTIDLVDQVEYCGRVSGRKYNKFQETKLTPVPSKYVKAPLIDECPVNIECMVVDKIKPGTHTSFFGKVVAAHVREGIWDGFTINIDKFPTISYAWADYRRPGEVIWKLRVLDKV